MSLLSHDRYCSEVEAQTGLLRSALHGTDLSTTVPTCPDWSLSELALHVGGAHRWAETIVRTRASEPVGPEAVPGAAGPDPLDAAGLDAWLAEGAEAFARTLRAADPTEEVWTWAPQQTPGFWARRMAHETVIHRADAFATAGLDFTLDADLAADCLDEWLEIGSYPQAVEHKPQLKELLGPGRTIHLHATDTPAELEAEWFVDLTGERATWRRAHEKAAVAVRGPLTDVLRVFYRRLPADTDRVEVLGDRELLDFWLERVTF
ncbi:maleylpyruvate isomerase family mycothiol-dependent enzyme [Streptomyces syringium]|uniref:maleylpyruvate isomerase family mycothiol-dependent enzyme n=1 Tax=Streptomyces syringium TaxID=76729 RepID=UPI003663E92C